MGRQDLLTAVVDHLRAEGLVGRSLREIAAAVGSSHRMLVYHFGSRQGLLAAVVAEVEAQERHRSEGDVAQDPATVLERSWAAVSRADRADEERLFFELAALALRDEPGTEALRADLVEPWLALADAAAPALGVTRAEARTVTRLDLAVVRGLLLDLLATGDRRGVNASFRRYCEWRDTAAPDR